MKSQHSQPREFTDQVTSRMINIHDGERSWNVHVNDTGGDGDVVVMLHGSGPGASGWANFNRNIDALANAGFRVLLVDCLGWGKSDPVVCSGSRSELNARTLEGVLDVLDIERVHIIGNSMGAHSAVAFALNHSQRVGRLVLMGGGTGGPSLFAPMPTEGIKLLQALYREPTLENLKRMMAVFVFDASSMTDELLQTRLNNMLQHPDHLQNFTRSLAANARQFNDYGHRLQEIKSPTLVIWGRDDRFVPMDVGLRLLAGLPDARMHVFGRCGHWAQWEHANAFNRLVVDFLSDR
jgi:2-hydroxy-6-oxonona-2,4-dienedioate hydrolase